MSSCRPTVNSRAAAWRNRGGSPRARADRTRDRKLFNTKPSTTGLHGIPPAPVRGHGPRGPAHRGEPLVPILRVEEGLGDPVALATWHEALSNALAVDVPHDLLGLWLFPVGGGAVLLGPSALAADDLAVPLPSPQLERRQLALLEEIVHDAGYGSVMCLPVRFGRRDVGLLLAADLRPGCYADEELMLLTAVARRLAPSMGRMARQWERRASGGADRTRTGWRPSWTP